MGGEKLSCPVHGHHHKGSPPRGRGKGLRLLPADTTVRITPAWAGKSTTTAINRDLNGDHPRVGGEKLALTGNAPVKMGSPPRGRGKDIVVKGHSSGEGITPAWAGKSSSISEVSSRMRDHPRVGGEKRVPSMIFSAAGGSPPRGRGKVMWGGLLAAMVRITPAWAGKSNVSKMDSMP